MGLFRAETGSFNQLLVSLGIISIAVAIVVPWLFVREMSVLSMPVAEINKLTPEARDAILDRQTMASTAQKLVPWFSGLFSVVGLVLLVVGTARMWPLQKLNDRHAWARMMSEEALLGDQSEEDKERSLGSLARDDEDSDGSVDVARMRASEPQEQAAGRGSDERSQKFYQERYRRAAEIREEVLETLLGNVPEKYEFRSTPKLTFATGNEVLFDGVYVTDGKSPDVVIDIQITYFSVADNLMSGRVLASARDLVVKSREFQRARRKNTICWLIVVVDREGKGPSDGVAAQVEDLIGKAGAAMGDSGVATVVVDSAIAILDPSKVV